MREFKEQIENEEIVHLESEIAQLQEIAERLLHDPPVTLESLSQYRDGGNISDGDNASADPAEFCVLMEGICSEHSDKPSAFLSFHSKSKGSVQTLKFYIKAIIIFCKIL